MVLVRLGGPQRRQVEEDGAPLVALECVDGARRHTKGIRPPGDPRRDADAEDFCAVVGELATGASVTLSVSRAAHGMSEHTIEACGTRGTLAYRLGREGPRWFDGELRGASVASGLGVMPVTETAGPAAGDQLEVIGRTTIAALVARFLEATERGLTPAPSFADGLGAQVVLDAVLESLARRTWMDVAGPQPVRAH